MKTALENLIVVLKDENTISPYEMCSSGLVQALFTVLNNVSRTGSVTARTPRSPSGNAFLSVCVRRASIWT